MRQRVRELKAQINDLYADAAVLESELMDISKQSLTNRQTSARKRRHSMKKSKEYLALEREEAQLEARLDEVT